MHRRTLVAGGATAALVTAATALAVAGLGAVPALATPTEGTVSASPAPPPEAILDGRVKAHADGIRLTLPQDAVVRDFTLTYAPGSSSGWHQHPGLVLATVVSGSVTRTTPCATPQTFGAGQAFVEVGPHLVQNPGSAPAVLSITQLAPAKTTGAAFREDLPAPVCRPHLPHGR